MNTMFTLDETQCKLAETHTDLVKWIIYDYIDLNKNVISMSFEDVYQEGCLALCRAAATYDGSTQFRTYAQVVIRNALYSYCGNMEKHHRHTLSYDAPLCKGSTDTFADVLIDENEYDHALSQTEIFRLLESVKSEYSGVTLKGIEALELKLKGFTGGEIAAMYGVKPTHVGAWMSRAAKKLRKNELVVNAVV